MGYGREGFHGVSRTSICRAAERSILILQQLSCGRGVLDWHLSWHLSIFNSFGIAA